MMKNTWRYVATGEKDEEVKRTHRKAVDVPAPVNAAIEETQERIRDAFGWKQGNTRYKVTLNA